MSNVRLLAVLCVLAMIASCSEKDYTKTIHDPLLYSKTVKKLNNIVLENNFPPMIASRNYVYAAIAGYECISAGDSNYRSLYGQIKHMPKMPQPKLGRKIDFQLASLLAFTKVGNAVTFPEGSMMAHYDWLVEQADDAGMSSQMIRDSKEFGDEISSAILAWSKKDNYAETRSAPRFTVTEDDGRWVPTPPAYTSALESHWMEIRTLVLDSASACRPSTAPAFNMKDTTSEFYKAAMEVKRIGDNLTEEQKHIAEFWDDNPFKTNKIGHVEFGTKKFSPGGHWLNIVGIASQKAGKDFNTTVFAYAKTAIALFEGFISCWDEKFRSNLVRPETVINKYIDPEWKPYIQTPPFPSYVSGHSVISAAAAEVMTEVFGDNFAYTDTSSVEFGIKPRSFTSFRQASEEAAVSRLYGGIHYIFDNEEGRKQGIKIGEMVVDRLRMRNDHKSPELAEAGK